MASEPSPAPPATIAEIEEAVSLLRKVRHYERMGVRMLLLSPGDPIKVRPVGHAEDLLVERGIVLLT